MAYHKMTLYLTLDIYVYECLGIAVGKGIFGAYTNSESPDQTAHMRSLIRAFAVRQYRCNRQNLTNPEAVSEGLVKLRGCEGCTLVVSMF